MRAERSGDQRPSEGDREEAETGKRLRCDECGVQSSTSEKLGRHKRLFHDNKEAQNNDTNKSVMFKCVQCKKRFSSVAKLLMHKNSHSHTAKPRTGGICNLCKSRFDDIKIHQLEKHILVDEKKMIDDEVIII